MRVKQKCKDDSLLVQTVHLSNISYCITLRCYTDSVGDWSSTLCLIDWTLVRIFFWCPARDTPILWRSLGKRRERYRYEVASSSGKCNINTAIIKGAMCGYLTPINELLELEQKRCQGSKLAQHEHGGCLGRGCFWLVWLNNDKVVAYV